MAKRTFANPITEVRVSGLVSEADRKKAVQVEQGQQIVGEEDQSGIQERPHFLQIRDKDGFQTLVTGGGATRTMIFAHTDLNTRADFMRLTGNTLTILKAGVARIRFQIPMGTPVLGATYDVDVFVRKNEVEIPGSRVNVDIFQP